MLEKTTYPIDTNSKMNRDSTFFISSWSLGVYMFNFLYSASGYLAPSISTIPSFPYSENDINLLAWPNSGWLHANASHWEGQGNMYPPNKNRPFCVFIDWDLILSNEFCWKRFDPLAAIYGFENFAESHQQLYYLDIFDTTAPGSYHGIFSYSLRPAKQWLQDTDATAFFFSRLLGQAIPLGVLDPKDGFSWPTYFTCDGPISTWSSMVISTQIQKGTAMIDENILFRLLCWTPEIGCKGREEVWLIRDNSWPLFGPVERFSCHVYLCLEELKLGQPIQGFPDKWIDYAKAGWFME